VRDKLTVLTTTNFVPSCPSTALVRSVIENFNRKFSVTEYDHLIFYDRPKEPCDDDERYLENLVRLDRDYPSTISIFTSRFVGLRGGWLELIARTKTPYFLFLEHDWHFTDASLPTLETLVDAMDRHSWINHVRFNKMAATLDRWGDWDKHHEPEPEVEGVALTRIWSWSNNPHLGRTSVAAERCRPAVSRQPFIGAIDPEWRGWPCGVEGIICDLIAADVRKLGRDDAHRRWGTYFVGERGSGPTVHHVCGRSFRV
jgi:hypothetical protein